MKIEQIQSFKGKIGDLEIFSQMHFEAIKTISKKAELLNITIEKGWIPIMYSKLAPYNMGELWTLIILINEMGEKELYSYIQNLKTELK